MSLTDAERAHGWTPPSLASPVSAAGVAAARVAAATAPLLGLERAWGWQIEALARILDRHPDRPDLPRSREIGIVVCRQSGKTALLQMLMAVLLAAGRQVLFTAHERQKARVKWLEIASALRRVAPSRIDMELRVGGETVRDRRSGAQVRLVTPDDGGGRSDTADVVVVDEGSHISPRFLAAAQATILTRPSAQIVLISSGMTDLSVDLSMLRDAAIADLAEPPPAGAGHAILEWSAAESGGHVQLDLADETLWERWIPTLDHPGGVRRDVLRAIRARTAPAVFAREFLSVPTASVGSTPITAEMWSAAETDAVPAQLVNRVMGIDVSPTQDTASIAVAGVDPATGRVAAALLAHGRGDHWIVEEASSLAREWTPLEIWLDNRSPAAGAAEQMLRAGLPLQRSGAQRMAGSCATLLSELAGAAADVDADRAARIEIAADETLRLAALGAVRRWIEDVGWAWHRRDGSGLDITPLVALSLAVGGARGHPSPTPPPSLPSDVR